MRPGWLLTLIVSFFSSPYLGISLDSFAPYFVEWRSGLVCARLGLSLARARYDNGERAHVAR